jgi:hypothetical protein
VSKVLSSGAAFDAIKVVGVEDWCIGPTAVRAAAATDVAANAWSFCGCIAMLGLIWI